MNQPHSYEYDANSEDNYSPSLKKSQSEEISNQINAFIEKGGTIVSLSENHACNRKNEELCIHEIQSMFNYPEAPEVPDIQKQKIIGVSGASKIIGIHLNYLRTGLSKGKMSEDIPLPKYEKLQNGHVGFTPQACIEWRDKYLAVWLSRNTKTNMK